MMFRASRYFRSEYLMWVLNSDCIYQQVLARISGSTSPHVNISDIVNFYVPEPPLNEQKDISEHISRTSDELDLLADKAEQAVAFLKERRAALISAAVTGKIDVRGLVPQVKEVA